MGASEGARVQAVLRHPAEHLHRGEDGAVSDCAEGGKEGTQEEGKEGKKL